MSRGRPVNPVVQEREQAVYAVLETPSTSQGISTVLGISVADVRLSLKRLRAKGSVRLHKVDTAFVWSRAADG